jgi:hypothetical protein
MKNESKSPRAEKVAAAKEALERGLAALQSGDDWRRMLEAAATLGKFSPGRYSFSNQILLLAQGADMRGVGTFKAWLDAGRPVKKGAKSHSILAPVPFKRTATRQNESTGADETVQVNGLAFRTLAVFDYSQTEGEELTAPELPRIDAPEVFERSVEILREIALGLEGSPVSAITFVENSDRGADGWFNRTTREIVVVTGGRPRADVFTTLVHEIAHSILHGAEDHHARPVREVEAESVAFIVSHALGLDTSKASFPYVAGWAQNGGDPASKIVARVG